MQRRLDAVPVVTVLLAAMGVCACAHPRAAEPPDEPPRAFQLLGASAGQDSSGELSHEHQLEDQNGNAMRVVAAGQTPLIQRRHARGRLYGDAGGSRGFFVDDFVLLEVLGADGQLFSRAVVGASAPLRLDQQPLEHVGRNALSFDPGEIDLTALLPESESFRIKATALDAGGRAKVSDLFLVLTPR